MLKERRGTYGYNFLQETENVLYNIISVGWQTQTSTTYYWDGCKRPMEQGCFIFQFTLSGGGVIELEDKKVDIKKCDGFLVEIPSEHKYYLPDTEKNWEFIYITLQGEGVINELRKVQKKFGQVFKISQNSYVVKFLWDIYRKASKGEIVDGYNASALAYEFIMNFYRGNEIQEDNIDRNIYRAKEYIENNYGSDLSLDDLSSVARMSKYHFNRVFKTVMKVTPLEYITKIRLENAVRLLILDKGSISEIAEQVGYNGANYFCKVFRKHLKVTPTEFKENYYLYDYDDYKFKL